MNATAEATLALLKDAGVPASRVELREFSGETSVLAYVPKSAIEAAMDGIERAEDMLRRHLSIDVFLVVRVERVSNRDVSQNVTITSPHVDDLLRLIAARNRVSEAQPSLEYVKEQSGNLALATSQRNHVVLGRRGVGKSTLLLEAKRTLDEEGNITVWVNFQTYRHQSFHHIFLYTLREICNAVLVRVEREVSSPRLIARVGDLVDSLDKTISHATLELADVVVFIPAVQSLLKESLNVLGLDLYIFVDDFYLIERNTQPDVLDMLHACIRDCRAWLKIATIKNLSRWYRTNPPVGLQTGHDVDLIDLDMSLEDPGAVTIYLEKILHSMCLSVGISSLSQVFRAEARDRLVLASGAVTRDYLVLASRAITRARERTNARVVGVQEVNRAAGDAADDKIDDLEIDVAADSALAGRTLTARNRLRDFCLVEKKYTYFRIDFRDKEERPDEYQLLTELLDLRMIHLVSGSLSDDKEAGRKYEVFMLDLSHYSGHRLKQNLQVLDLSKGQLVLKKTSSSRSPVAASNSLQRVAILRRGPIFPLDNFSV